MWLRASACVRACVCVCVCVCVCKLPEPAVCHITGIGNDTKLFINEILQFESYPRSDRNLRTKYATCKLCIKLSLHAMLTKEPETKV